MKRKKRKFTVRLISFDTRVQMMEGLVIILTIVFSLLVARNILQYEEPKPITKLDKLQKLQSPQVSKEILQKYKQKR